MLRFLLFLGFLVGVAYVLTDPGKTQKALSANEIRVGNDKPLLTSWGPTLGSLRDGVGGRIYAGGGPVQITSGESSGSFGANPDELAPPSVAKDTTGPATVVAATNNGGRVGAVKPKPVTTAALQAPSNPTQPSAEEPTVDRIAAALPPQRRGLFGRAAAPQREAAPRTVRQAQAGPRNGGLFKRLIGRNKPAQRAWALGPTR